MRNWRNGISMGMVLIFFINIFAFAEIPDRSVVIGQKGFSLRYANSKENVEEIREAIIKANGRIFVKVKNQWFNNDGTSIDSTKIPRVNYKWDDGRITGFHEGDGEEISDFKVVMVEYRGRGKFYIRFNKEVMEETALKKDNYSFIRNQEDIGIRRIQIVEKDMVYIELNRIYFQEDDIKVVISEDLKSKDGGTIQKKYSSDMKVNDYVPTKAKMKYNYINRH